MHASSSCAHGPELADVRAGLDQSVHPHPASRIQMVQASADLAVEAVLVLTMDDRRRHAKMIGDHGHRPILDLDHLHDGLPWRHELGGKGTADRLAIGVEVRNAGGMIAESDVVTDRAGKDESARLAAFILDHEGRRVALDALERTQRARSIRAKRDRLVPTKELRQTIDATCWHIAFKLEQGASLAREIVAAPVGANRRIVLDGAIAPQPGQPRQGITLAMSLQFLACPMLSLHKEIGEDSRTEIPPRIFLGTEHQQLADLRRCVVG